MIGTDQAGAAVALALECVLLLWVNWAGAARAIFRQTEGEVVFERPIILRVFFGCSSVLLAALLARCVQAGARDAALYGKSAGVEISLGDNIFLFSFLAVSVGLPCLLFLWMAGPYRVVLDFNCRRYRLVQGAPPLTRIKHGATDGGTFYVVKSKAARHQMRFRPSGHRWGYLLATYDADEQARTQAHQLADKLGLTVERGDTR